MPDNEWFRNLAEASYEDGHWQFKDRNRVERTLASKLETVVSQLLDDANDAIDIYNHHVKGGLKIKNLPIAHKATNALIGFVLLLGDKQVKLVKEGQTLQMSVLKVNGHDSEVSNYYQLNACYDPLGSLLWKADGQNLLGNEMIIKLILEELVKA